MYATIFRVLFREQSTKDKNVDNPKKVAPERSVLPISRADQISRFQSAG